MPETLDPESHEHEQERSIVLRRTPERPILEPSTAKWENLKVYNAGVVYDNGRFQMLYRAMGKDLMTRLGYAESKDGVNFQRSPEPVFSPQESWESKGTEDPRITKIGDTYHMVYNAWDGETARVAMATSKDLKMWEDRHLLFPDWEQGYWQRIAKGEKHWSKAGAIFPEKIGDNYMMFFGDDDIWYARSENLRDWTPVAEPVLSPRPGYFDAGYLEMGPPPIKTPEGWLILYHGVQQYDDQPGNPRIYRLGAALTDLEHPREVIWRSPSPIIEPNQPYEIRGLIDLLPRMHEEHLEMTPEKLQQLIEERNLPQAVFSCGAVAVEDELHVYYGAADTVICHAEGSLSPTPETV